MFSLSPEGRAQTIVKRGVRFLSQYIEIWPPMPSTKEIGIICSLNELSNDWWSLFELKWTWGCCAILSAKVFKLSLRSRGDQQYNMGWEWEWAGTRGLDFFLLQGPFFFQLQITMIRSGHDYLTISWKKKVKILFRLMYPHSIGSFTINSLYYEIALSQFSASTISLTDN